MSRASDPTSPAAWKSRITRCQTRKQQLVPEWAESVSYRRGKPFADESDQDRVAINLDWSKTKAKHANLFSQVPEVRLASDNPQLGPAVAIFAKHLNKSLTKAKLGTAVDECVIDTINASGFGAVAVTYERRTESVEVPTMDLSMLPPEDAQMLQASGHMPTQKVDRTTDWLITNRRFSPTDLLWPVDFTGSDFDDADWIGRSGVMPWAQAKHEFALAEDVKETVLGGRAPAPEETLTADTTDASEDVGMVAYDEIFYWAYRFDPDETSYTRIKRLVFVTGIEKAVVDGDWAGQKVDEASGKYIGACKFPIRVLTLTYVSDDCIPPSDSAIGRPQVLELIDSRSQMLLQRRRSIPIRGFDVNRVDPEVQTKLLDGTWQGMIPMNGPFSNAIWEIARANYPREDMEFDRVAKHDLDEVWQTGANQAGSFASGERSAREAQIVQQNFQTRVGYERGKVAEFLLGIAKVHAGLLALYGEFETPEWDRTTVAQDLVFSILPDATVILDANQKLERIMYGINMLGKSGLIDPKGLVNTALELMGLNPSEHQAQPQPPKPEMVKISIGSADDVRDPLMVALLIKTGQAPSPEDLEAAKQILTAATSGPQMTPPMEAPPPPPNEDRQWDTMPKVSRRSEYQ